MKYLAKFWRFLHNPAPYFLVMRTWVLEAEFSMMAYRCIVMPLLVWRKAHKGQVNVVFLVMNPDMWRYGDVYRRLKADNRFNPIIVTAMRTNACLDMRIAEQDTIERFFHAKGVDVVRGYNVENRQWINIDFLSPDIIFYTQPYEGVIDDSFSFRHHWDALHCYSPYFFQLSRVDWNWNNLLQNYCWRQYFVGEYQVKGCREMSKIRGRNARAVGYCLEEEYAAVKSDKIAADAAWKGDRRKRVIWAPHHSILPKEMFKVSSFLEISDLMVKIRNEYVDRIIFAFKPHPILKGKLYDLWGKDKADAYYESWAHAANSFDAQGNYQALFAGSDAMIHCSGSFIVEYLYADKPVQYCFSKTRNPPDLGEIGDAALAAHYPAHSEADIRAFLDDVVMKGHDTMAAEREAVAKKYLKSANGKYFSENVYEDLVKGLWG